MKNKMVYFNGRALFSGLAISYIFLHVGTGFWISGIIGFLLGLAFLFSINSVNTSRFYKFISGFAFTLISASVLVNMGHTLYFKDMPVSILTVVPLIGALIISESKAEPLKKVLHVLFIYSIVLFFLKVLGLYPHIDTENFYPIERDFTKILWGAFVFALVGIVPVLSLKGDIKDKKSIAIYYSVSMLTILGVSFLAMATLGLKEAQVYRYPEYIMLKKVKLLNFISNVDSFFNFAVILDALLTMSAGLKNIEFYGKKSKFLSVPILGFLIWWSCYENWPLLLLYHYFPFILIFLLILLLFPQKRKYNSEH